MSDPNSISRHTNPPNPFRHLDTSEASDSFKFVKRRLGEGVPYKGSSLARIDISSGAHPRFLEVESRYAIVFIKLDYYWK